MPLAKEPVKVRELEAGDQKNVPSRSSIEGVQIF